MFLQLLCWVAISCLFVCFEKDHRGEVSSSPYLIKYRYNQHDLTTVDADFDHLDEVIFVTFLHFLYMYFFLPLLYTVLWKEVTVWNPY